MFQAFQKSQKVALTCLWGDFNIKVFGDLHVADLEVGDDLNQTRHIETIHDAGPVFLL